MKIEIQLEDFVNKADFAEALAYTIADKYHDELFAKWKGGLLDDFDKKLQEKIGETVNKYIEEEAGYLNRLVENALSSMTKAQIIELLGGGKNIPF